MRAVDGDPNNLVYVPESTSSYKLIQTPVSTIGNLNYQFVARCNKFAAADILVGLEVDNSLIDAYNADNGTQYVALPDEALVWDNKQLTIPAGKMRSADTCFVKLTEDVNILKSLNASEGYLVPVKMASVNGAGAAPANSVKSVSYLIMTVTNDAVNHDATIDDAKGTPVTDRSGWSLSGNVDCSEGNKLFDGDPQNYVTFNSGSDMELIIDMGKVYEFDAIEAKYAYGWGSWSYDYGSLSNGTNVYLSNDGKSWQSVASIEYDGWDGLQHIVFWGYMSARYIKLQIPATSSWGDPESTFECGHFTVYAK